MVRKARRMTNAFTLIEILLAISLAAILLALVYGAYAGTVRSVEDAREWTEICQMSRFALACFTREIESAYFYAASPYSIFRGGAGEDLAGYSGLTFVTSSPLGGEGTLAEVSYFLEESEEQDEGWVLYHRVDVTPDDDLEEGGRISPLAHGLAGISFSWWDGDEWREMWDAEEEGVLPSLVRVEISFLRQGTEEVPFHTMISLPGRRENPAREGNEER